MELTRRNFLTLAGGAAIAAAGLGRVATTRANAETADGASAKGAQAAVEIAESGYYFDEAGNGHYAILLKNDSANQAAVGVPLSVSVLGSDGQVVSAERAHQKLLLPMGTSAVCGSIAQVDEANLLEFKVLNAASQWEDTDKTQADYDQTVHAGNLEESTDALGLTTVTGEVVNDSADTLSAPDVDVVFRDVDGTILGGASTTLENVPSGTTARFEIGNIPNVPEHASLEAYVNSIVNA